MRILTTALASLLVLARPLPATSDTEAWRSASSLLNGGGNGGGGDGGDEDEDDDDEDVRFVG
jgi:hypothetical protein